MPPDTSSERTSVPTLEVPYPPSETNAAGSDTAVSPTGGHDEALKHLTSVLTRQLSPLTNTIARHADRLVDAPDPKCQRESAMDVLTASARIEDLLAELRHYSRPADPSTERVRVPGIVEDTIDLLDGTAQTRVRTKVEPEANRSVDVDPELIHQALLNLLRNALEATSTTETVLLRAAIGNAPADADSPIAFEVWNDGEIELDDPSVVFQPFYSTRPQHLGLGLSIANDIAEQHGGSLRLSTNSVADGGTCFTLTV